MQRVPRSGWTAMGLSLALLMAASTPAIAQHAGAKDKHAQSDDATPEVAGQTAAVDPASGKLRALTPEEARALAEGISRYVNQSTEGLVQERHADGSVSLVYDERFESVLLARAAVDGKPETRCVNTADEAAAFLGAKSAKAKPAKKAAKKAAVGAPVLEEK